MSSHIVSQGSAQIIDLAQFRATRQLLRRRAALNARRQARRQTGMQITQPRQVTAAMPLRLAHSQS